MITTAESLVTIVMYHYVRPIAGSRYPQIRGLEVTAFERQLDYLQQHHSFVTARDIIDAARAGTTLVPSAALLTFDDGYADHHRYVLPVLERRGIGGVFFPPSCTAIDRVMLDVNRIHFILAAVGNPSELVRIIDTRVDEYRREFNLAPIAEYHANYAHANRFDSGDVIYVKRMLQRALPRDLRHAISDELFRRFVTSDERAFIDELYMDAASLRDLIAAGMEVGSHGHTHQWLDGLDPGEQRADIEQSLSMLDAIGMEREDFLFCYPYGSYDERTLEVLGSLGCGAAFTTRVALARPAATTLLELPRLDTNDLPTDADAPLCSWTVAARTGAH